MDTSLSALNFGQKAERGASHAGRNLTPDSKSLSRWDASLSKYGLEDDRWDYPSLQATWNWNGPWKVDSSRIVRKANRNVPSWAITEIQRILTRGCYIGR
jgi:hypothetical protein